MLGLLFSVWLFGASAAHAMGPDVAVERFNQGAQFAQEGKFNKAIELWLGIVDALPSAYRPIAHLNIGQAYEAIENLPAAWFHVLQFADQEGPGGDGAKILMEIESRLRNTHRKVPLSCDLPGARIRLKGAKHASYPCANSWWFVPGKHTLTAFLSDDSFPPRNVSFDVNAVGPVTGLFIPLRIGDAKGADKGAVSTPKGTDGDADKGSVVDRDPKVGNADTESSSVLSEGSSSSALVYRQADTDESGGASLSWAILGSGLAVAAVGGAMHGWAFASNQSALSDHPDGDPAQLVSMAEVTAYNARYDEEVEPKILAAYVLYGAGAAAALTGLILSFFDAPTASDSSAGTSDSMASSFSPSFVIHGGQAQIQLDLSF